jgi:hypothetical protein
MKRFLGGMLVMALLVAFPGVVHADDPNAMAVLDKAIKALGGEEKLAKADTVTWKTTQSITGGGIAPIFCTARFTTQGLDRSRMELEIANNGEVSKIVSVLNGDNYWSKLGDPGAVSRKLEGDELVEAKRGVYIEVISKNLLPLKRNKAFKVVSAGEEKVGDSPAAVLRVTGPEGGDFKLFIDKESGLLVKMEVAVARGFTTMLLYSGYKEYGGIKWATKIKQTTKEIFTPHPTELVLSEFKVLEKAAPDTFAEPK